MKREIGWLMVGMVGGATTLAVGFFWTVVVPLAAILAVAALDRATATERPATVTARTWSRALAIERYTGTPRTVSTSCGHGRTRHRCSRSTGGWERGPGRETTGDADEIRRWPADPPSCAEPTAGCERVVGRTEGFQLVVQPTGHDPQTCDVPAEEWDQVEVGEVVVVRSQLLWPTTCRRR